MKIIKLILLFAALGGLFVFHISLPGYQERMGKKEPAEYVEIFTSAYKAYSWTSLTTAYDKTTACAEELYRKELAEGKTDKEYSGLTKAEYFLDAFNSDEEQLSDTDRLALSLPLIFIILLIVATIKSITFGLKAIKRLKFDNIATEFTNKK